MHRHTLSSIIIPSYNNAHTLRKHLPGLIHWMNEKALPFELIVVDDGSTDHGDTALIAEELGCIYLRNNSNRGKGAAVRKGMMHATGTSRIFTDADIPFEYETLERMIPLLENGTSPVVVGDRTLADSVYFRKISRRRKLSSVLYSSIVGRVLLGEAFDTQCGIKGFTGEAATDIYSLARINGFASDVEVVVISKTTGLSITRIPVKLRSQDGASVHVFRHAGLMILDLFRIGWNKSCGRYNKDSGSDSSG
jgi:dolichyl-phosphate beta-glucosyltransferase